MPDHNPLVLNNSGRVEAKIDAGQLRQKMTGYSYAAGELRDAFNNLASMTSKVGKGFNDTLHLVMQQCYQNADPLDLDWIAADWPHALFNNRDNMYLIGWKQVQWKTTGSYQGAMGCHYRIGGLCEPSGAHNWTLSPLGAMKNDYGQWLLAAVLPVERVRMDQRQVLIAEGPVVPVWAVRQAKVERDGTVDATRWLQNPNLYAESIDWIERSLRRRVDDQIKAEWIDYAALLDEAGGDSR